VWAAAALARIEPENAYAIPALVAGTRDQIYFVRSLAAWHLGRLGPQHPGIEAVMLELRELVNRCQSATRSAQFADVRFVPFPGQVHRSEIASRSRLFRDPRSRVHV
jgi:HEAT repeat protein